MSSLNAKASNLDASAVSPLLPPDDTDGTGTMPVEVSEKIVSIRSSLSPRMRNAAARRRTEGTPPNTPENDLSRAAAAHGIDMDALRDIKAAFDAKEMGEKGVTEREFIQVFGPTLCEGMSRERMRMWFRSVDNDCSGRISWDEISQYLLQYTHDDPAAQERMKSNRTLRSVMEKEKEPYFVESVRQTRAANEKFAVSRGHSKSITHLMYAPQVDTLYSAATDGMVRCWNPHTMKCQAEPVHRSSSWIHGLTHLPHNGRLMVLHSDRTIFLYNTYTTSKQVCHEMHHVFASQGGPHVETFSDGTATYNRTTMESRTRRQALFQSKHTDTDHYAPCTLLAPGSSSTLCIESMAALSATTIGEPVLLGMGNGNVEAYNLVIGSNHQIQPSQVFRVHDDWVTQLTITPELEGFLSSSTDGTIRLTDIEKGTTLQTMRIAGQRPVFGFDYTRHNNTLVSCGGRSLHVWNALTGAKMTSMHDHESPLVKVVINPVVQHVYALMDDKRVKIWDLRTWRAIDTVQDTTRRYPEDTLTAMLWVDKHSSLVCGSGELFAWQSQEVAERSNAGISTNDTTFRGHLRPVLFLHVLHNSEHIVAVDETRIVVWGLTSHQMLYSWKWTASARVTASAVDNTELRVLFGTDSGELRWFNYTSGHAINRLKHRQTAEITVVETMDAVARTSPGYVVAATWRHLMLWYYDANDAHDAAQPHVEATIAEEHGGILSITRADVDKTCLVVGTQSGNCLIVTAATMSVLQVFKHPNTATPAPIDIVASVRPGVFAALDGVGHCRLLTFDAQVPCLATFITPHSDEETPCCFTHAQEMVFVGDTNGCISAFNVAKLNNLNALRKDALVNKRKIALAGAGGMSLTSKMNMAYNGDAKLAWCVQGHAGTVTGLGVHGGVLYSSGHDRRVRAWSVADGTLVADLGHRLNPGKIEARSATHQFATNRSSSEAGKKPSLFGAILGKAFQGSQSPRVARLGDHMVPPPLSAQDLTRSNSEQLTDASATSPRNPSSLRTMISVLKAKQQEEEIEDTRDTMFELATRRTLMVRSELRKDIVGKEEREKLREQRRAKASGGGTGGQYQSSVTMQLTEVQKLKDQRMEESLMKFEPREFSTLKLLKPIPMQRPKKSKFTFLQTDD